MGLFFGVLAEHFQRENAGAGAGAVGTAAVLITKTSFALDGEAADVGDALVQRLARDRRAAVGRATQGHELPAGDGDIRVVGVDLVSPSAGVRALGNLLRIE